MLQECSKAYAFDPSGLFRRGDDGVYACQNETYTVIEGKTIRCVDGPEDCERFYVAEDKKVCVDTPYNCQYLFWYKVYNDTGANECISN